MMNDKNANLEDASIPIPLQEYLFDLQGYLNLHKALTVEEVGRINLEIDTVPRLQRGEWHRNVRRRDQREDLGVNLQQVLELGGPFEELIDHQSWIDLVLRFVGGDDGLQLAENFVNLRGPGEAIGLHSGAHKRRIRTCYRYHNSQFRCGQINILVALTDIGPGDGATMVIPGSHKSNIIHPRLEEPQQLSGSVDEVEGAIEVYLEAGDALLFVDCLAHGSARRVNEGERRILIYRYGPQWGNYFSGYQPSEELLNRLNVRRRTIVQPVPPIRPPN